MKRRVEIVLGIIGALGYAFLAALGEFMLWMRDNRSLLEDALNESRDQSTEVVVEDFETMVNLLGSGGWILLISSIAAIVLGIIAMVLLKGNKRPIIAGIIFITTAVIVSIITTGVGIVAGIFYLAAGIMCVVRKPQRILAI